MVRSGLPNIFVICLLVLTASQGLDAAPRRLKQATGLPNIPNLDALIQQLQSIFPGLDLQTLVSMIESGQFGATSTPTPEATPAPTTQATPTPTTPAPPTPTTQSPPTPTMTMSPPTPTTQAPPTPMATMSPPTPPASPAVPPSDTVQTQSVSSSPPPASQPPSDPATATPPVSAASQPPVASTPPPSSGVPPPISSSDAVPPSTFIAGPPAQSTPPTAPPTTAISSPPAASPPVYAQPIVLERTTSPPQTSAAVPPPTNSAVPPPTGSVQTQSAEDPRDQPCTSSQRTSSGSSFTCAGFDGYYCNGNANGMTGTSTCGGTWRCESISSQPSVYGMLAAYPSSSPNSAIGGYCHTSDDCSANEFCDKSPQTNWAGDRSYGNCVAYLAQGCKA